MPTNRSKTKSSAHRLQVQNPEDEQVVRKTEDVPGYRSQLVPPEAGPSHVSLVPTLPAPTDTAGSAASPLDSPPPTTNPSPSIPKIPGGLKTVLQAMVEGNIAYSYEDEQLGKRYLALDCEMVGVGPKGARSSLARVSIVDYDGTVQLDEFVRQRERVVDYRTQYSGVRKLDLAKAKSFEEIQNRVAGLLKDKVLVGHAVVNDLKALSLKHPQPQILDTQFCAWKHKVSTAKRIALRHLVKQELGLTIQDGEHSSVTDARATMAVFRLHEREWEKDLGSQQGLVVGVSDGPQKNKNKSKNKKRKRKADERNGLALESPAALNPGRGGSALGSQSGVGWVWGWDPEPDEWVGWEEEPKSRPGLGWSSGPAIGHFHWVREFEEDDIKYWGRDASQGWSW